jgi:hypothetical protein
MSDKPEDTEPQVKVEQSKIDEFNGVFFSTSVKIHDPNTEEVLVQLRGDI